MFIYKIENIINGKKYIGQTVNNNRWSEHKHNLNNELHHNKKLQSAWNKYGKGAFKFEILQNANSLEELDKLEIEYIKKLNSIAAGYNMAAGGQKNRGFTYYKIWNGLVSPIGEKYLPIKNLEEFSRQNNLNAKSLRKIFNGTRKSYKGWTVLNNRAKSTTDADIKKKISIGQRKSWIKRKQKLGNTSQGNPVQYNIWVSDILNNKYFIKENLSLFCRKHNLDVRGFGRMIQGYRKTFHGWKRI